MTEIAFLDGGLGQEIDKRSSSPESHPLWSVKVMLEQPEIVKAVHLDYIEAGAKVLTVNAYTATPTRMAMHGYGDRLEEAQRAALEIITGARNESGADVAIAGCLPPLAASYVASAAHDFDKSLDMYRLLVEFQNDAVDLFLVETIADLTEARAAVAALKEAGRRPYVGLTISDDDSVTLRSGEPLAGALEALGGDGAEAVMLNCSLPEAIDAAMPTLAAGGLRFGAYANGFTTVNPFTVGATVDLLTARRDLGPEAYAGHVDRWVDQGATIIGGCCEIGPAHISHLAGHLKARGFELVKMAG